MLRFFIFISFLGILFSSCSKEDELITGRITGQMMIYDQFQKQLPDRSGIIVSLLNSNGIVATDTTDNMGGYLFEDIPYGRYRIFLNKDKYIKEWDPPFFDHVGGFSPTYINLGIFEVPVYNLTLDSVSFDAYYDELNIRLKLNGDTIIPPGAYLNQFIAYISDKPEVSKDNFVVFGKGYLADYTRYNNPPDKVAVFGRLKFDLYPYDRDVPHGMVYMKVYPLAQGQGYRVNQFYEEALGKPSNVISFDWDQITAVN
ncbi:MAG TPA: hypothetical protein PLX08_04360 [Bacteroidales bacterium]|nr:hypothetical protein [Bacteroidales bacterium]